MLEQAISKLKAEIEQNKNNFYIQVVGEFLLQHLDRNPQDADKILVSDKTVGKSLDEMRKAAEKKKFGSCAVITDQEGIAIVLKYFGIDTKPSISVTKPAENVTEKAEIVTEKVKNDNNIGFDVKLEDLL